jgi:hypothetical protein
MALRRHHKPGMTVDTSRKNAPLAVRPHLMLLRSRVTDVGGKAFCDVRVAEMRGVLDHWDDRTLQRHANWDDAPSVEGYAVWPNVYYAEATIRPTRPCRSSEWASRPKG